MKKPPQKRTTRPRRKPPPSPGPPAPTPLPLPVRFERLLGRWPVQFERRERLPPETIEPGPYRSPVSEDTIKARQTFLTLALEHLVRRGPDPEAVYNVLAGELLHATKTVIARVSLRAAADTQDNVRAWVKETKRLGMGFVLDLIGGEEFLLYQFPEAKTEAQGRGKPPEPWTKSTREALKRLGVKAQTIDHLLRAIGFLPLP